MSQPTFDTFLSHSHYDAEWVEKLAKRLEDEFKFEVWLDKWVLVPGTKWQQEIARGLDQATTCVTCLGAKTPSGWFQEEIEHALNIQAKNDKFRVIPLLLPDASSDFVPAFLSSRTWVDFRTGKNHEYAFHVLVQGIKGLPVGRWPEKEEPETNEELYRHTRKLEELKILKQYTDSKDLIIEFERKIFDKWLEE